MSSSRTIWSKLYDLNALFTVTWKKKKKKKHKKKQQQKKKKKKKKKKNKQLHLMVLLSNYFQLNINI